MNKYIFGAERFVSLIDYDHAGYFIRSEWMSWRVECPEEYSIKYIIEITSQ